jgi:hypothetical protein
MVGFFPNIDASGTSYLVMELMLDNGQWNKLSYIGSSAR